VDRRVAPANLAQPVDVVLTDGGRLMGHADGEVAERAPARLEIGPAIVVSRMPCKLFWCALGTEVVCMRANSVVAVVRT
jgi:hypothetical protein